MFVSKGFTMVELMIGLALAAILLTLAVPNFITITQNSDISASANDFVAHINRARMEAISRNEPVILCRSANFNLADPENSNCGGSAQDTWNTGWLVYTAPGTTSGTDDYEDIGGAELLAFHQGFPGVDIKSDGNGNRWLAFNADGSLNESGPIAYAVCDERSVKAGKLIEISMVGRVSMTQTTSSNAPDCDPS